MHSGSHSYSLYISTYDQELEQETSDIKNSSLGEDWDRRRRHIVLKLGSWRRWTLYTLLPNVGYSCEPSLATGRPSNWTNIRLHRARLSTFHAQLSITSQTSIVHPRLGGWPIHPMNAQCGSLAVQSATIEPLSDSERPPKHSGHHRTGDSETILVLSRI